MSLVISQIPSPLKELDDYEEHIVKLLKQFIYCLK